MILDFNMALNGCVGGVGKVDRDGFAVLIWPLTKESPFVIGCWTEVFLHYPFSGFVSMSPFSPTPQGLKNLRIHLTKHLLANNVTMIVCPTPDDRVELVDQVAGCGLFVGLDDCAYFGQECFDTFLRGFDEEFTLIFAYILP